MGNEDPETAARSTGCPPIMSIIIPAHNAAETLGQQLEAIRTQTYEGKSEIIIVDNRSTDATGAVVRFYQRLMPSLRLISAPEKPNSWYARNVGVQAARGSKLIFCDADDMAAPGWLSAMARALEEYDFVAGGVDIKTLNRPEPLRPFSYDGIKPALNFLPYASGCNMGIARRAFEAVSGFAEDIFFSQDLDISWRLQLQGYPLHYEPAAVMLRRQRGTLRSLWKQIASYSQVYPLLYRRFAPYGMPRPSLGKVFQRYKWLMLNIHYLVSGLPKRRAKWIYEAAICWGRLLGSLQHRTLFL